jgi:hypothetical protein
MTIQPRDVLSAFSPKFKRLPPPRFTEDDSLLIEIRDKIAKAENVPSIRHALRDLLRESLLQMGLEDAARTGLIGVLASECEFAAITENA